MPVTILAPTTTAAMICLIFWRAAVRTLLQWNFMRCPAGLQFQLHAHANIELIYCCAGALHEIRMQGEPITKQFTVAAAAAAAVTPPPSSAVSPTARNDHRADDDDDDLAAKTATTTPKVCGPALTNLQRPWSFGTLKAGQWLVNEVGSIHQSFTATNESCQLLVLWGGPGSHANVSDPPLSPNVQEAVNVMDRRLCCCYDGSTTPWALISETFLPDSEKAHHGASTVHLK